MIKNSLLLSIFTLFSLYLSAQSNIYGKIVDADTKAPIPCVKVYVSGYELMSTSNSYPGDRLDTIVFTNFEGVFTLSNAYNGSYSFSLERSDYHINWVLDTLLESQDMHLEIELFAWDSPNYKVKDVASSDRLDMGYGFSFYSPALNSNDKLFAYNLSYEALIYEGRIKLGNRSQLGFKGNMMDLNWAKLKTPSDSFVKENYFSASLGLFAYYRWIATLNNTGYSGLFFDIGVGYRLPYYTSFKQHIDDNQSLSTRKIHRYNDVEAMVRIGYSQFALKACYRFTDNLKNPYIQTPKLSIGIELLIPFEE